MGSFFIENIFLKKVAPSCWEETAPKHCLENWKADTLHRRPAGPPRPSPCSEGWLAFTPLKVQ